MATYSAFFSSGLLAPQHVIDARSVLNMNITPTKQTSKLLYTKSPYLYSPAAPSSPSAIPDDSDVEDSEEREGTPTPGRIAAQAAAAATHPNSQLTNDSSYDIASEDATTAGIHSRSHSAASSSSAPRLRRRRSSLTVGASPMTAIKSATRTAEAAAQLQRRLSVNGRPRSGSVGGLLGGMPLEGQQDPSGAQAPSSSSLLGRMRSGSVGGANKGRILASGATASSRPVNGLSTGVIRPRRALRRAQTTGVPALAAPPPNAPLPALPPVPPAAAPLRRSRRSDSIDEEMIDAY
ncbi:hypothetical protein BDN72DRAFT_160747 [Pluteus cervinus]|uniref:Uncharacterized protein n=1 Tax=Pluteus cervinus TaxID=181527 RepID=A0ACD3AK87_9AGAR|nr:hypothetical protein BDN72DRAFT_160747 [Pluteus cervinus]